MLSPKRTKYRKTHRGRAIPNAKFATRCNTVSFGDFGLIAQENTAQNSQKLLYPVQFDLNPTEFTLLKAIIPDLTALGFEIQE